MHSHDQNWDDAKGMSDEALGGRPDFEGFIAALRAEADGTEHDRRQG